MTFVRACRSCGLRGELGECSFCEAVFCDEHRGPHEDNHRRWWPSVRERQLKRAHAESLKREPDPDAAKDLYP